MSSFGRTERCLRVVAWTGLLFFLLPSAVQAQFSDCGDTLALVSPRSLSVEYVESPVQGNQLWWPALDAADGSCIRAEVPAGLAASIDPEFLGSWHDLADRQLTFTASTSGVVGSKTDLSVGLSLESNPPNPAVPALSAQINLSGAGGIFRASLINGVATQQNVGLPEHLSNTDVTAIAAASLAGGGVRVYAAVTGIPLVRSDDGGASWYEPLVGDNPIATDALNLVVSPKDPDVVFMGTPRDGLLRSDDGGQTWTAADSDLRSPEQAVRVLVLEYLQVDTGTQIVDRLYLSLRGLGFFFSDDDGATWTQITNLQVPVVVSSLDCNSVNLRRPDVESLALSPTDQRTLYLGLRQWGVYKGTVDHSSWVPAFDGMVVCAGAAGDQGTAANVTGLAVHPQQVAGEDVVFASTEFRGVFVSTNGATSWSDISQTVAYPRDDDGFFEEVADLVADPSEAQGVLVGFASAGLWRWSQVLGDWARYDDSAGVFNPRIGSIEELPGTQDLMIGTTGSGVYEVGDEIELSRVLEGTGVDLGISLRFNGAGSVTAGDTFDLFGQAFQAYVVWRALSTDAVTGEPQWQMIGLYDLTNPEFCSLDPCDSPTQRFIPDCFADKRANCFNLRDNNGQLEWGFFDADVFNGFTYHYAVSTLDYGYTGNISPRVFNGDFLFSPRHPAESSPQSAMFLGVRPDNFAYRVFQANAPTRTGLDQVYAVPNPLQRRGAWDIGTTESTIRFANVTPSSKVQIFTLAGDLVRVLENVVTEGQERGNIQWDTRNAEGNQVASGVYIYRVTDANGAEFVSKVTIIR